MPQVQLPDGTILNFPDDMTQEQIRGVLREKFPGQQKPDPQNMLQNIMRYGVKGPAAGAVKTARNIGANMPKIQAVEDLARITEQATGRKQPSLQDYSEEDINQYFGLPPQEQQNLGDLITQAVPEGLASVLIPEMQTGRIGQLLQKIPYLGKGAKKAIEAGVPLAAAETIVAPTEERGERALLSAAGSAPFGFLGKAASATSPTAIKKAGSYLGSLMAGVGAGEGLSALGAPPMVSALGSGLAGAATAKYTMPEVTHYERLTKGFDKPQNKQMLEERLNAANRLGLDYLTPAEALKNPTLGKRQGALGRTEEGSELMYARGQKRYEQESDAINNLLDEIYTEKLSPEIEQGYKRAYKETLSEPLPKEITESKIVKNIQRKLENDPWFKDMSKDLPKNETLNLKGIMDGKGPLLVEKVDTSSIGYWDLIKRRLYDAESRARKNDPSKANYYKKLRQDLVSEMDKQNIDYANARRLSERQNIRKDFEKAFDRTETERASNFFRKALQSKKDFDSVYNRFDDMPEIQQRLNDMRMIFGDLMGPPTIKGATGTAERGMFQGRNPVSALKDFLEDKIFGGTYDKQLVEFITSPDWADKMKQLKNTPKELRTLAFMMEISQKPGGAVTAQIANKEDEK